MLVVILLINKACYCYHAQIFFLYSTVLKDLIVLLIHLKKKCNASVKAMKVSSLSFYHFVYPKVGIPNTLSPTPPTSQKPLSDDETKIQLPCNP